MVALLFDLKTSLIMNHSRFQALQTLFKTLLNQLMTGKVRVKDFDFEVKENV